MASLRKHPGLRIPKSLFSTSTQPPPPPPPPFPSFRAAKSAILAESNPDRLAQLFEQSSHFPTFRRHRPLYHVSFQKLAKARRFDLVDRLLLNQISQSGDSQSSLKSEGFWIRLMMIYSNAGMVDEAMRTFDRACEAKCCDITEKSLCAVLSVHLNNGLIEKVHGLFEKLPRELKVTPTAVAHNLVLKAFAKDDNTEAARAWMAEMEGKYQVIPNIDSYNILLGAYLKNGDLNAFDGVVKEILGKGLDCNVAAYNLRIAKLCKNKECARANKLLAEMIANGLKPNSASYNAVIDGFARLGDFESAKKVLDGMVKDRHVAPCSFTYYTLLRSMVREGEFDSGLEMCREIIKRRWVPPFEAVRGLVDGLLKMSKGEEAKDVVEKMKGRLKGNSLESWGKVEAVLPL
ncbi:pentatricopeptide repeat-containing protein At1g61870, mitochondrial-like [Rhodamnia argentea]|uniref:Pentatricopeptide repeat-containing protein At1g61870, mitochondrial-like n=1 Tax=Rhodamnia argentea TaxID=178133 RepID=A0A8B8QV29_9MYRT|nr:pentatricopeptide repeat-containing protein At1g61870, mitochondrial-like [Rhodamnia argentea]